MPPKRTDTGDVKKCHFETIRFASTYYCLLLCVVVCYWYVYHRRSNSSLRHTLTCLRAWSKCIITHSRFPKLGWSMNMRERRKQPEGVGVFSFFQTPPLSLWRAIHLFFGGS